MANQIDLSGDGGVLKEILKEGNGDTPCQFSKMIVHYTGTLASDGSKFDSSRDRDSPFEFDLGKGSVIKAWDIGIASMKIGEVAILTCAPEYAYGASGSPPSIPPNSILKFEVEIVNFKGQSLGPNGDDGIVRYVIERSDKKKTPNDGASVKVHLVGKYEERIFEEREVEFNLGEGEEFGVIEGVQIALEKFNQGEVSRLVIKPKYAFGSAGHKEFNIPANATVEYKVTLIEFEKALESWKLDKEESFEQARIMKEKGTNYFKQGKYNLSLKLFEKANSFLSNCGPADGDEVKVLAIAVYLNKALCYQKLNDLDEVRHACDEVLSRDEKSVKAYFRRGQASLALGQVEKALEDFTLAQKYEPENKAAANQISICQQKLKECYDKEKKLYANMFSKFADKDISIQRAEDEANERSKPREYGVWGAEEIENRELSSFEKDFVAENPDIVFCPNSSTKIN